MNRPASRLIAWHVTSRLANCMNSARFLAFAIQAIEEGNKDEALSRIARVMGGIAGFHLLLFLEVPAWCPPRLREELDKVLADLRRQIDVIKRLRESGGDPPVRPMRKLMN